MRSTTARRVSAVYRCDDELDDENVDDDDTPFYDDADGADEDDEDDEDDDEEDDEDDEDDEEPWQVGPGSCTRNCTSCLTLGG